MKKLMTQILWILSILLGLMVLLAAGFIVYLSVHEFSPKPVARPLMKMGGLPIDRGPKEFTLLTWNIGYAGLGKEQDFFYDGGKKSMPEKEDFLRYFDGIKNSLAMIDSVDFILIQELDTYSKRTYFTDELKGISGLFPDWFWGYSMNWDCRYMPVPVGHPMGSVISGIFTMSRYRPDDATTFYFGTEFSWPQRLVMLKRCYMVLRYRLDSGHDLVVINTHNSAFDANGELRRKELQMLHQFMLQEYKNGNYVVAGGDWNSNPRGFGDSLFSTGDPLMTIDPPIEADFLPGWEFVYDHEMPTNRSVEAAYEKGKTKTTVIDFFVVSPNVKVDTVKTISLGFENSDHNPVVLKIGLLKK
jgi:endonuclease/exonuclease/phosphatase family metal-dependent hydrolase